MGANITSRGASGLWDSKMRPRMSRGLEGIWTFDTDATRFGFNRAEDKNDAAIIGAPVAYSSHGRFKGLVNYLQTDIGETPEQTIIVIGKAVNPIPVGASGGGDDTTPFYVGNRYGASIPPGYTGVALGTSLYHRNPTTLTGVGGRLNAAGTAADIGALDLANDVPTDWGIRVIRVSASNVSILQNVTRGIRREGASSTARVLSDTKFRIGSATTSFAAEVDISTVAIYSAFLTDEELAFALVPMRKRMARLGVNV